MNTTRQDAWTKDEDILLAETVLRYIREGMTQLEAFKEVAKQLSRTSAACGFRWNASIRKKYNDAILLAKEQRKQAGQKSRIHVGEMNIDEAQNPIDMAILLLEKMKSYSGEHEDIHPKDEQLKLEQLEKENEQLKQRVRFYEEAWNEVNKLSEWIRENS